MTSGKIALAAADANAVALLQPTAANYFNVGQCFLQGKAYDAAVSTLSSAIETVDQKDPQLFMLYHLRGSANLQLKALDEAIGDLTTAIELAPQLKALVSYNARSVCYAQLNQLQLANKDCDWVLALSPNDANAKRTKAFVTQRM
jgi:tetratricopeptide (TPR) repeat protein